MEEDAVVGVTSNPSIFQKALARGRRYDEQLKELLAAETDPKEIFLRLARSDIERGAATLRPVFERERGRTASSRWRSTRDRVRPRADARGGDAPPRVDRRAEPLREDPGDEAAGSPRSRSASRRASRINVTLIFSLERYAEVMEAYIRGARAARASRRRPGEGALGRELLRLARRHRGRQAARGDRHRGGARAARQARDREREARVRALRADLLGARWEALAGKGATPQRCLWASTSTKNPDYRDVIYVEELIGPDTVNTMPVETIEAFQDHGEVRGDTMTRGRRRGARRCSSDSRRSASTTTTSSRCSSTRACRSSPTRSRELLDGIARSAARSQPRDDDRASSSTRIWERDPTRLDRRGRGEVARLARRAAAHAGAGRPRSCAFADGVADEARRGRPARDGRLEPRAGGAAADLRRRALPRARHDPPGGDPRARGADRPRADALRLGVEVGLDARDALAHGLLLGEGRQRGAQLDRDHRSRLGARALASERGFRPSSPASRRSAGATRRCRRSGSCPPR